MKPKTKTNPVKPKAKRVQIEAYTGMTGYRYILLQSEYLCVKEFSKFLPEAKKLKDGQKMYVDILITRSKKQ